MICNDRQCCLKLEDIFNHSHALTQNGHAIERLNAQPELKRVDYLLSTILPETGRNVHQLEPIRAAMVGGLTELDRYHWTGHAALMGCSVGVAAD